MIKKLALVLLLTSTSTVISIPKPHAQAQTPSTSPAVAPTSPAVAPTSPAVAPTSPAVAPTSPAVAPTSPAVAPTSPAVAPASTVSSSIPSGTVIRVTSNQSGFYKIEKDGTTDIELVVAEDVIIGSTVALPAGTPLLGTVQEKDGGARFVISSILANNRLVPLNATSTQKIVSQKVSKEQFESNDLAQQRIEGDVTNQVRNVGSSIGNSVGGGIAGGIAGTAAGAVATSLFSGGKVRVVEVNAGQPYLVTVGSAAQVDGGTESQPSP